MECVLGSDFMDHSATAAEKNMEKQDAVFLFYYLHKPEDIKIKDSKEIKQSN